MKIFKDKTRLVFKLFIIVWVLLLTQILLKITFNYWQPYVIPNSQLENIGNFIDKNRWIQIICNCIFYVINSIFGILCGIQRWWFKDKKQALFSFGLVIWLFLLNLFFKINSITIIIGCFIYPLILDYKKWLYIIITFVNSFLFLALSLWLEGIGEISDKNYIITILLNLDYYIMLGLNYMLFNLIRMKGGIKEWVKCFGFHGSENQLKN